MQQVKKGFETYTKKHDFALFIAVHFIPMIYGFQCSKNDPIPFCHKSRLEFIRLNFKCKVAGRHFVSFFMACLKFISIVLGNKNNNILLSTELKFLY